MHDIVNIVLYIVDGDIARKRSIAVIIYKHGTGNVKILVKDVNSPAFLNGERTI